MYRTLKLWHHRTRLFTIAFQNCWENVQQQKIISVFLEKILLRKFWSKCSGIPNIESLQYSTQNMVVSFVRVHYFEWTGLQIKREKQFLHSKTGSSRILLGHKSPKHHTTNFKINSFIDVCNKLFSNCKNSDEEKINNIAQ